MQDASAVEIAAVLGRVAGRLKRVRGQRRLTLTQVAEATGTAGVKPRRRIYTLKREVLTGGEALGTMSWGRDTDEHEAREQLAAFVAAGGTLIDTAAAYGEPELGPGEDLEEHAVAARERATAANS